MLGCGRSVGTKPFPHSPWLYSLVQAPSRKENSWSGKKKNPPPRNTGLFFSSPVVLSFPECFGLGCILLRPAGNPLGARPLPLFPLEFEHLGVFWFLFVFQVKLPASASWLLPNPCLQLSVTAPGTASPRACSERWAWGCQWDAPGERQPPPWPRTASGDCCPQEGLPEGTSTLFGAESAISPLSGITYGLNVPCGVLCSSSSVPRSL